MRNDKYMWKLETLRELWKKAIGREQPHYGPTSAINPHRKDVAAIRTHNNVSKFDGE